jgi:hypothetical protein
MALTLSVRVLPRAGHTEHLGLAAQLAFGADLARHARDFGGERVQLVDHGVDRDLQLENLSAHVDGDLAGEVAAGHGRRDLGDVADLGRQVGRQEIHVVREVLPRPGHAGHRGLAAQPAFGADLARNARHFGGKSVQLIDHRVQRFLQLQDLAADVDGDLLGEVAAGDGRRDLGDVADLRRQVRRHEVDVVGEVFPGAADSGHLGLPAQLAFGADLARYARHFTRKAVQLVDHRVDRVFQLEDLAADVHGDLARQVTAGDGGRHLGDVADLGRQVAGHGIDRVGEVFPGAGHPGYDRLAAQLAFRAHFASDARDFGRERAQLVDHRIDGFLELENLAPDVHRDLAGEVAAGDRDRHLRDVADLGGEIARHRVDAVGEILPDA